MRDIKARIDKFAYCDIVPENSKQGQMQRFRKAERSGGFVMWRGGKILMSQLEKARRYIRNADKTSPSGRSLSCIDADLVDVEVCIVLQWVADTAGYSAQLQHRSAGVMMTRQMLLQAMR